MQNLQSRGPGTVGFYITLGKKIQFERCWVSPSPYPLGGSVGPLRPRTQAWDQLWKSWQDDNEMHNLHVEFHEKNDSETHFVDYNYCLISYIIN